MKPRRTASGVATITVITKPWPCASACLYCPNDVRMPKSYLANEPACQRAEHNFFDPYLQVVSRVRALAATADNDDFYQPPAQFSAHPQAPGTVLRTQPVDNTRATKMLYASTDQDGKPVAVSGYVIEPDRPAIGTVVFAPGTRGQGDMCAPSKGPWLVGAVSPTAMSVKDCSRSSAESDSPVKKVSDTVRRPPASTSRHKPHARRPSAS